MEDYQVVIIGAGVSGLVFARTLQDNGIDSFLLLEKESSAGGLCRSEMVDGFPIDIGGGHFLDIRNREVLDFLFRFLPEVEWRAFGRKTTIRTQGYEIDYPFESNLWQFPLPLQLDYLESAAEADSVHGEPEPSSFREWVIWKFGNKIASDYMLPYNSKIWSIDLNRLSTKWLHKLPRVYFRDILQSVLIKAPTGKIPAHARFLYPVNYGYGEVWRRIAASLEGRIRYGVRVEEVDHRTCTINGTYRGQTIINTIPWTTLLQKSEFPETVQNAVQSLEYASIRISYHPEKIDSPAYWIYVPDEAISFHRILCRQNFIPDSCGYWTESNLKRESRGGAKTWVSEFAYPINTVSLEKHMRVILDWGCSFGIYPLGRWGQWEHINSDVAVERALEAAKGFIKNNRLSS